MKMNRRWFLSGVASVASMWKTNFPISLTNTLTSWVSLSNFRPYIIEDSQLLHLYSYLAKSLPNNGFDIDNIDPIRLKKFQLWLSKILPSSKISDIQSLGTIESMEHFEYWIWDMYMKEYKSIGEKYGEWLDWIPNNIKNNIIWVKGKWLNVLFNEDALLDTIYCATEWITPPVQTFSFGYLKTWWQSIKWDIKIEFSFDSRNYDQKWRYRLINNSIQEWTTDMVINNPSELSKILEMPESTLREIMDKSEKIKLKEKGEWSNVNKEAEKENSEFETKKISKFQSFLLNTTSMNDIKVFTWDKTQEVLDYLDEYTIKKQ